MGTSYIDTTTIADLHEVKRNGFATRLALQSPPVDVALTGDRNGSITTLPAQRVLLTYDAKEDRRTADGAAVATFDGGTLQKEAPFDVAMGDTFLRNGALGHIVSPPMEDAGIITVRFTLDIGGGS